VRSPRRSRRRPCRRCFWRTDWRLVTTPRAPSHRGLGGQDGRHRVKAKPKADDRFDERRQPQTRLGRQQQQQTETELRNRPPERIGPRKPSAAAAGRRSWTPPARNRRAARTKQRPYGVAPMTPWTNGGRRCSGRTARSHQQAPERADADGSRRTAPAAPAVFGAALLHTKTGNRMAAIAYRTTCCV